MEEVQNEVESGEMHSGDDKVLVEKNKKRTVKTRAQVQALEKFYSEQIYPTESMKVQLAESIGLTEKQVSGWFCHRRLKDKKLRNGDNYGAGRQDRSSGIIQDRGSGLRQDSCGSTKQGDNRIFDTKEVESRRLTIQEYSAAELTYERGVPYSGNNNRVGDASSGSSSSLRNMSNHYKEDHFNVATSRYQMPRLPVEVTGVKPRPGPSGYLKVKGQVDNTAITAVKRQLGKHYQEDGPPLSVEFDPLPPGAFESSMQDPVDETCYTREDVLPASPDISKIHQDLKFRKGCEYKSSTTPVNSKMDRTSFKAPQSTDIPVNYGHQKFKQNNISNNGAYHSWGNTPAESLGISARDKSGTGSENRDEYGMRHRQGVEAMRLNTVSSKCPLLPLGGKLRGEQECSLHKLNEMHRKSLKGGNIEKDSSSRTIKGLEYNHFADKMLPGEMAKDGKIYAKRSITNDNQAPKGNWDEFPQQRLLTKPSVVNNHPGTYSVVRSAAEMRASFSEDEGSAETSSSVY